MKTLSVIVPCYNEEAVIGEFYRRIKAVLSEMTDVKSFLLFVNDGSKDATKYLLEEIASQDNSVQIIHLSRNFGHQSAVTAGLNNCITDFAVIIDSDLQDPPELIPDLLSVQESENANVVYCVRKERLGETWFKKWSANMFYRAMNYFSEVEFPRNTGDFRLMDHKTIGAFNRLKERGKYVRGLVSWLGFKQVPYYYNRDARYAGITKYPLRRMLAFAEKAMLYFSKKPLKISVSLGIVAFCIGTIYGLWVLLGSIFGFLGTISGWTSTVILIIFFGGIQLLTIGVLGQYIGILFDEVKERPEYVIDEKINFVNTKNGEV